MSYPSFRQFVSTVALTESADTFAVMAIEDPTPGWKQHPGRAPEMKVVWQMWGLEKHDVVTAAKIAREKHPRATISVENRSGKIVKVFKPGQPIHEIVNADRRS